MADTARLACECPPGSVNLGGFPFLVYAPDQWGPRVVVIPSHVPAGEVAAARANGNMTVDALAAAFGCEVDAVTDALRYAKLHPDC